MCAQPTLLIIGAGIAGLSAGIFAQKHGFQSNIFEMHDLPGGLCTAWERKGYTFDGCIHYLFGSGVGQPFYDLWQDLGVIQERPFIHHDEYMRLTDGERTLIVYADPDRLESHLLSHSPQDARPIRALCRGVRDFARFDMAAMYALPKSQTGPQEWAALGRKMLPYVPALASWASLSCLEFGSRFKDPFLRRAIPQMFSWEEAPLMMGMMLLAYMHTGNAGFPAGEPDLGGERLVEHVPRDRRGRDVVRSRRPPSLRAGSELPARGQRHGLPPEPDDGRLQGMGGEVQGLRHLRVVLRRGRPWLGDAQPLAARHAGLLAVHPRDRGAGIQG